MEQESPTLQAASCTLVHGLLGYAVRSPGHTTPVAHGPRPSDPVGDRMGRTSSQEGKKFGSPEIEDKRDDQVSVGNKGRFLWLNTHLQIMNRFVNWLIRNTANTALKTEQAPITEADHSHHRF